MIDKQQEAAGRQAAAFVQDLRAQGVLSVAPCRAVQRHIIEAVTAAVREERFSFSMLGHLADGLRIAVVEYLLGEPSQGYHVDQLHPRTKVALKNISGEAMRYCARAILSEIPQEGNVIAYSSETGRPYMAAYEREWHELPPGEVREVGASKALSLLKKHAVPFYSAAKLRGPKAPTVTDKVREVCGQITVYDRGEEEVLTWGEKPKAPKPAPKKAKPKAA